MRFGIYAFQGMGSNSGVFLILSSQEGRRSDRYRAKFGVDGMCGCYDAG
jgi:hypothetical protein